LNHTPAARRTTRAAGKLKMSISESEYIAMQSRLEKNYRRGVLKIPLAVVPAANLGRPAGFPIPGLDILKSTPASENFCPACNKSDVTENPAGHHQKCGTRLITVGEARSVNPSTKLNKTKHKSKSYNADAVSAFFVGQGIPAPEFEYQFHETRKWRFDLSWPFFAQIGHNTNKKGGIAVEVDGGIWIRGGHNRGAQMKKDWEKRNTAVAMGWKIITVEPSDLCTKETSDLIKTCFEFARLNL
jgi:hypothetical protein